MNMSKYTLALVVSVVVAAVFDCTAQENPPREVVAYEDDAISFAIDANKGHLLSFKNGREFLVEDEKKSLFFLQFRNTTGAPLLFSSSQATEFEARREDMVNETRFTLAFNKIAPKAFYDREINATVSINCPHNTGMTYWKIDVDFKSVPFLEKLEFIEFPCVTVPNEFPSEGGELELFWPFSEGCLVDDPGFRLHLYRPVEYPTGGWYGLYPGPLQMQYMSLQSPQGGLYYAAHDAKHNPKEIEYLKTPKGVKLIYKVFTGAAKGSYHMEYPMLLGGFEGDWYEAARIYREFATSDGVITTPKLKDNPKMVDWMKKSPVVSTYAVRGEGHHAGPTQPNKLYPYENVLPHLARYQKEFGTDILNILMQYEGTSPWSPPYVWPPMGGEKAFREYVNALHAQGNQVETTEILSTEQGANHLLLRTAYSFTIGDLMTIVLTEEGEIHWAWCTRFSVPVPDQESIITLIRNLTAWRKQAAHDALVYGRMEKPFSIIGKETADVHVTDGSILKFDKVLTSRFLTEEGGDVQLLVNWQETPQQVTVALPEEIESISVISDSSGTKETVAVAGQRVTVEVAPLNALLLGLSESLSAETEIGSFDHVDASPRNSGA